MTNEFNFELFDSNGNREMYHRKPRAISARIENNYNLTRDRIIMETKITKLSTKKYDLMIKEDNGHFYAMIEAKNDPCDELGRKWKAIPKSLYVKLVIFQVGRGSILIDNILPLGMEITIDEFMFCSACGSDTAICNCIKIDKISNRKEVATTNG